jgi:hypothetical protein
MTTKMRFVSSFAGALGLVAVATAGELVAVAPQSCIAAGQNGKVAVRLPADASSARVYFHAEGQTGDYYLDMKKSGSGEAWAMLPRTAAGTTGVVYQIRATGSNGRETLGRSTRVAVGGCAAQVVSGQEASFASNLVVGQTLESQPIVPPGFLCDGIVSLISSKGEMRASSACLATADLRAAGAGAGKAPATGLVTRTDTEAARPLSSSRP